MERSTKRRWSSAVGSIGNEIFRTVRAHGQIFQPQADTFRGSFIPGNSVENSDCRARRLLIGERRARISRVCTGEDYEPDGDRKSTRITRGWIEPRGTTEVSIWPLYDNTTAGNFRILIHKGRVMGKNGNPSVISVIDSFDSSWLWMRDCLYLYALHPCADHHPTQTYIQSVFNVARVRSLNDNCSFQGLS